MNADRAWILLCVGVAALAGFAAGVLWIESVRRPDPPRGAFAAYEERLVESLDLSPARERLLHELLRNYRQDALAIRDRYIAGSMSAMEPELRELGERYTHLIRGKLLTEEQRAEFDRLCAANLRILPE